MHRASSRFKSLAAALALAMVASVALPVLAFACETGQQHTVLAMCCMDGEAGHAASMPCHEDATPRDHDAPHSSGDVPGKHFAACCSSSDLAVEHEATRDESPEPPQVRVLVLDESLWAQPEASAPTASIPADEWPPATGAGVGLHVLYGALLN